MNLDDPEYIRDFHNMLETGSHVHVYLSISILVVGASIVISLMYVIHILCSSRLIVAVKIVNVEF